MERELVRAILANEALIAVTGHDRAARTAVLDRAQALLGWQQCRTVRLRSPEGKPLDLQSAMNQVVGPGYGGAERVERFFDEIALPVEDEQHIVLMVDDAQRLTSDLLSYLALIGPTTVGQDLRLQVVFAGDPTMWDKLPRAGSLAADRIETRIVVGLAAPIGQPLPKIEPLPEPPPPRLLPETPPRRVSPTDGHVGLRDRLAQRHRRRERLNIVTPRVTRLTVTPVVVLAVVVLAIVVGTAVLWARMPELRAAVHQWATTASPSPAMAGTPALESPTDRIGRAR